MITITIAELKRFLSNARAIKDVKAVPILSYVKLECKGGSATLTKTNLHSFVVTEVEAHFKKDETILIDEKVLTGAVNFSKGDEMKISVSGQKVILDDSFGPVSCQFKDAVEFPAIESNDSHDKMELSTEFISALSTAKVHALPIADKEMTNWMHYVYVKKIHNKTYVIGTSGGVIYFRKFDEDVPYMALDPDTINAIGKYIIIQYSSTEKYDYFQSLGVTYGFIKPEAKAPQLEPIVDQLVSTNSFEIARKDLMWFCEKAISINNSATEPVITMVDSGKKTVKFDFVATSDNESAEENIPVEKKSFKVDKTFFFPKRMLIPLKEIIVDKIKISRIKGHMILSSEEEENYLGSVMEYIPPPQQ